MKKVKVFLLPFYFFFCIYGSIKAQCPASVYNNYKFNETQGVTASGLNSNVISFSNVTWTTGKLQGAVSFNGTTSKGVLNDNFFNWTSSTSFSIEFWFNLRSSKTQNMVIIGRDDAVKSLHWWVGVQSSNLRLNFTLRDNAGTVASIVSSSATTLNTWYHVAVVRKSATNSISLYINGQLTGSSTVSYTGDFSSTAAITLGLMNYNGADNYYSNVDVDELVIHNTALSNAEITDHYNKQLSGTEICPVQGPPTDSTIKILTLGNSITYDNRANDTRPESQKAGYRVFLYNKLKNAGYKFDLIGSEVAGQDLFPDAECGGFPGISKDQLVRLLQTGYNARTGIQVTNGPYLDFYSPDIILLHIGTNGVTTDITAINQILTIVDQHRVATGKNIKLIIARIINRATYDATTSQYNKNLEDAVKAFNNSNNYVVDMEYGAGINYSSEMNDNLHPTDAGYEKMASLWFSALSYVLPAPSASFVKAPGNLYVTAEADKTTLTWTDNSTNETGFTIERKIGNGVFEQIAQTGANISSYTDLTIQPLTKYTYRLNAISSGNKSVYSNEAPVQTPAGNATNVALGKTVMQSSTQYSGVPERAIDNNTNGRFSLNSVTHTTNEPTAYWQIDLQGIYNINNIQIWNRTDACCIATLTNYYVFVSDVPFTSGNLNTTISQSGVWNSYNVNYPNPSSTIIVNRTGRYIRVQRSTTGSLSLAEVMVIGTQASTPAIPVAPQSLTSKTGSTTSVQLSWSDNSTNEKGFRIERKTGTGAYVQVAELGANVTTFSDQGLQASTTYTYRVNAYNDAGNSEYSNESTVQTPAPAIPAAPQSLTAQPLSSNSVSLSWTDNSANETGFSIERKTGTGTYVQVAELGANVITFSDQGLQASTTYTYRVYAYNDAGNSEYSNESIVQTPADVQISNLALNKPVMQSSTQYGGVPERAIDNNTSGRFSLNSVTHTTNESTAYWQIDLQGIYNISNIQIWNRTDACCIINLANYYVFVSDVPFTSGNLNTTLAQSGVWNSFNANYPNPSTTINVNRSGRYVRIQKSTSGPLSLAEVMVMGTQSPTPPPVAQVPAAPQSLIAQVLSSTGSSLSWTDNSNDETGFRVERKTGTDAFVQIAQMGNNVTTYTDQALQASTSYTYRVYAYNDAGNSSYSNESTIQTPAEVQITNLALNKPVVQSSTQYGGVPERAIDNNTSGAWSSGSVTHTINQLSPFWQIDLQSIYNLSNIEVWDRTDNCCYARLSNFYVFVSDMPFESPNPNNTLAQSGMWNTFIVNPPLPSVSVPVNRTGRYVRVQLSGQEALNLAEIRIMGYSSNGNIKAAASAAMKDVVVSQSESNLNENTAINIYPNPSDGELNLEFELKQDTKTSVSIINVTGAEQIIFEEQILTAGNHLIEWNGLKNSGMKVAPGIYVVKITLGENILFKKVIITATH